MFPEFCGKGIHKRSGGAATRTFVEASGVAPLSLKCLPPSAVTDACAGCSESSIEMTHRNDSPRVAGLDFQVPPQEGAATESAGAPPSANDSISWLSQAVKVQSSILTDNPQISSPPGSAQNADTVTDNIGASDGTTGETAALTSALSKFSIHTDEAANRTSAIPDAEKKRINDAMFRADNDNPVSC